METLVMEKIETSEAVMVLYDSYTLDAKRAQVRREDECGIDPQRLMLYRLGQVAITGEESDLLLQARRV
jgi:hypothetical protein